MVSLIDTVSRRRLLLGAGVASALIAGNRLRSTSADVTEYGNCTLIPAMEWYREFQLANFMALPYRELNEHLPDNDWIATSDPEMGPFLVPGGWTTANLYANEFDRTGTPIWGTDPLPHPRWTATMVTEPEQNAFYMMINGVTEGDHLLAEDASTLVRELAIGPETETESFCLVDQLSVEQQIPKAVWLAGDTFGDYLIMSNGHSLWADFAGMFGGPGSRFMANVVVCPYEQSDEYMKEIFLRILWQFVPQAGGGAPTPTPSPTP